MMWEAVFFDFDGVICDSVNIKTEAFAELYRPYGPETEKKVVDYHLANGGVSRYEKFRYWHREFLKTDITEDELKELSERFTGLVLKKILEAPYVKGAVDSLRLLKAEGIPAYIVSGTPNDEINYIINKKGLGDFFLEVHGSPRGKEEIVKDILDRQKYNKDKCVFIGDAMSDYKAAESNNIHFLGIVPEKEHSIFPSGTRISSYVYI